MVMHAFHIVKDGDVRYMVGNTPIIDQPSFDLIRDGEVIQVQTCYRELKYDDDEEEELDATAQAALALTQLAGFQPKKEAVTWFVRSRESHGHTSAAASVM